MSGINSSLFLDGIEDFKGLNFSQLPKGDILQLGVNPYNGNVVMRYQDTDQGVKALVSIFDYIFSAIEDLKYVNDGNADFLDFLNWAKSGCDEVELGHFAKCPRCGVEPVYSDDTHSLKCDCEIKFPFRFEDFEQALEVWNYTRNYREAA